MEFLKSFLIGGSIITATKYFATRMPSQLAPLIGGMPVGILASFFLENDKEKKRYYAGYTYSAFTLFLTILFIHAITVVWPDLSMDTISAFSLLVWGVVSYVTIMIFVMKEKKT